MGKITTAILILMLISISTAQPALAQENPESQGEKRAKMRKSEQAFTMEQNPLITAYVTLHNNKIIFELNNSGDYNRLRHLDSILINLRNDISFYKDSLNNSKNASVRIDYAIIDSFSFHNIRFIKHDPVGDIYIDRNGKVSKLKIDQDTVRVLIYAKGKQITLRKKDKSGKHKETFKPQYTISAMFCLNNYTDIDKIIADSLTLRHIVDTLASVSPRKEYKYATIAYNPYDNWRKFTKSNYVVDEKNIWISGDMLILDGGIGVGLIKNTITPMADIGVEIKKRWSGIPTGGFAILRLSTTPYFFFEKYSNGNTAVKDNWFVNIEAGSENNNSKNRGTIGIGYLYAEKGAYLQKTVMKAFANFQIGKLTVGPELIFNDNFKQVFPGLTLKFLNLGN